MRFNEFNITEDEKDLVKGPPYKNSDQVKAMQHALEKLGYSVGSTGVDGKYGHRTAQAVRSFKKDFNIMGSPDRMNLDDLTKLASAKPKEKPTATGNEIGGGDQVTFASGEGEGRVTMAMKGTRNQPIQKALMNILKTAADEAGVDVQVFSGGQDYRGQGGRRTGSIRHDGGYAADVYLYSKGKRLRTDNSDPIVLKFIAAAVDAGARGIGAGPGYMGSAGIHVDLWGSRAPGGGVVWGKGGKSRNAPGDVRMAYRAGQSGTAIG
jgi:peptidoglycan hydrolase-like protein with peptidoglycan-binding domain